MSAGMPAIGQAYQGRKLGDIFFDEVYWYILTVVFTGSDNQIKTLPIQSDAHFLVVWAAMNSSLASGAGTFQGACVNRGGSLVQLKDNGTGRELQNTQVPADVIFGSAQRPCVWPMRKVFRANTSIGFNVTDTTAAAQTVDYVLGGIKIPLSSPTAKALGLPNTA